MRNRSLLRLVPLAAWLLLACGGSDESLGLLESGGAGGALAGAGGESGESGAGKDGGGGSAGSAGSTPQGGAAGTAGGSAGEGGAGGSSGSGGATSGAAGSSGSSGQSGAGTAGDGGSNAGSDSGGASGAGDSGAAGDDAGGSAGAAGNQGGSGGALAQFCEGTGSVIPLPGSGECTGDVGKKTFLFALCSCSSVKANNLIHTDSLDSSSGQSTAKNGSVGVVGNYDGQQATIGGSFWVDGSISTGNKHTVAVDLQCGGDLNSNASDFSVGRDAYMEGDFINAQNKVSIGKTLHIPAGKNHNGVSAASVVEGAVNVLTPCACDEPIDIAGVVAAAKGDNDNEANKVTADTFVGLTSPETRTLPCGRYFFSAIQSTSTVTVKLTGHTAIFIEGNVTTSGALAFELGPEAELDLFIAGNLTPDNSVTIGDKLRPAATRVYIAGDVVMSGQLTLAANLYMPNTVFSAKNTIEMWGALYAKGLALDGALTVHYDEAILEIPGCDGGGGSGGAGGTSSGSSGASGAAGGGQAGGGQGCDSCGDCPSATPACVDGACGPCTKDSDCCPPLICNTLLGTCNVPGGKP